MGERSESGAAALGVFGQVWSGRAGSVVVHRVVPGSPVVRLHKRRHAEAATRAGATYNLRYSTEDVTPLCVAGS